MRSSLPLQERAAPAYCLLIALAVGIVVSVNLITPLLHDNLAIYWVWADQFTAELARGSAYPRWLALSNGGLGAPVFYFYPPLAFYVTAAFGLLGLSTYASLMGAFVVALALSGIACWHWLEGHSNHPLLGSAFFMVAPYHLFDFAVRGGIAECLAFGFIPLVGMGLRRISKSEGGIFLTATAYAAMICSHLPLALLVSLLLIAPYALIHPARLRVFTLAVAAGLGLAAIYLVPALALQPYHDVDKLSRLPNLRTDYWSIYAGHWNDGTYVAVFLMLAATLAAAAPLALLRRSGWALYAMTMSIIVAGIVPLLWSLPLLRSVQFPWRALPIAEFALATALAQLPRRPGREAWVAALPLLVSAILLAGFQPRQNDVARLRAMHPDVYEYLPKGALQGDATNVRLKDLLASRLPPPRVPGMVVEPTFYFPAWSCGEPEPRTLLLMHAPGCTPRLRWTWPERVGATISAATALLLLLWALIASARAGAGISAGYRRAMPS